ncbi:bifunctional triacylglycerol lipase/ester hydrolase [Saccharomycopsis crataegensis]|uniref:Bifunctional triacylglycerol lipase/ester hydrolase n=1 Tax=Saccharomycopsis crataegensis TaxID=43959 RepID=A0AAV5QRR8_9ASCO|nr:bifunctional triacylglycerol lipase/ester hydrolase [Saccharomycopsis crataegensis]
MPLKPFLGAYKFSKHPVSIYHIPVEKPRGPLLVFIPGNPGIVDFYVPYLNQLHTNFQLETLCISHISHDCSSMEDGDLGFKNSLKKIVTGKNSDIYGLDTQISSKIEIINNFLEHQNGDLNSPKVGNSRDVIVFGHSVGSYMVQRVVNQLSPKASVKFVGLVFPTIIDIGKSDSGVSLTRATKLLPNLHNYVSFFTLLFMFLPSAMISWMIRSVMRPAGDAETTVKCVKKLVCHPLVVRQALGLGKEEMGVIKRDLDFNDDFFDTAKHDYKVWCFFAQNDHWVAHSTRDAIKARYFNDQDDTKHYQMCDEEEDHLKLKHSFVINHTDQFVKITSAALKRMLGI